MPSLSFILQQVTKVTYGNEEDANMVVLVSRPDDIMLKLRVRTQTI